MVNTPLVLEDKVVEYSVEYLQGSFSRTDLVLVGAGVDEAVEGRVGAVTRWEGGWSRARLH